MRSHVWRKALIRRSLAPHRRHFRSTAPGLSSTTPPPSGPGTTDGHSASSSINDRALQDQTSVDKAVTAATTNANSASTGSGGGGGGGRRRYYSKRTKEITPFSVPDWFLKYNVRLCPDQSSGSRGRDAYAQVFTLTDRDTGHVVLTLPVDFPTSISMSEESLAELSKGESKESSDERPSETPQESTSRNTDGETDLQDSVKTSIHGMKQRILSLLGDSTPVEKADKSVVEPASMMTLLDYHARHPHMPAHVDAHLMLRAIFSIVGPQAAKLPKANLNIRCYDQDSHRDLDGFVEHAASLLHADVVRIDASDIADLASSYVENDANSPGSISSLAFDVYRDFMTPKPAKPAEPDEDNAEEAAEGEQEPAGGTKTSPLPPGFGPDSGGIDLHGLMRFLRRNGDAFEQILGSGRLMELKVGSLADFPTAAGAAMQNRAKRNASTAVTQWDNFRLQSMLDALLDGPAVKRDTKSQSAGARPDSFVQDGGSKRPPLDVHGIDMFLSANLTKRFRAFDDDHRLTPKIEDPKQTSIETSPTNDEPRTIVHVRDLDNIRLVPQGDAIVERLVKIVQRRRREGQQIVIVGTSICGPDVNADSEQIMLDESHFRTINIPAATTIRLDNVLPAKSSHTLAAPLYPRVLDINLRNIQQTIRRIGLSESQDLFAVDTRRHLNVPGTASLGESVLSQDEIEEVVLLAEGLRLRSAQVPALDTIHVAVAAALVKAWDLSPTIKVGVSIDFSIPNARSRDATSDDRRPATDNKRGKVNMEQLKKTVSKHEARLLGGVVDSSAIKTTFDKVHASKDTIEALQTLTSLSLSRPEAFSYGVLATERLPGLLLYGPPGTGKTLLAKAVAKDSSATVLEISGAQVYEKYVGEGEKMVKAVFSLAKKLSPCVVFLDEADAIFGSRGGANNRTTHREIINQFLREWDGMDDHSVFIMVATNRPFDLDDAVLRRLPRRLLVDLPVAKDREAILGIHLKDEKLAPSVSLARLAEETPLYSGSDLKNMCVAAALAAVREENDSVKAEARRAKSDDNPDGDDKKAFELPDKRTLTTEHFAKAMQEISASISEDMSSLGAIRKFDEQFGDRKRRRKRSGLGFGGGGEDGVVDENAARVRQDQPRP